VDGKFVKEVLASKVFADYFLSSFREG